MKNKKQLIRIIIAELGISREYYYEAFIDYLSALFSLELTFVYKICNSI